MKEGLRAALDPRSIAVVGASARSSTDPQPFMFDRNLHLGAFLRQQHDQRKMSGRAGK